MGQGAQPSLGVDDQTGVRLKYATITHSISVIEPLMPNQPPAAGRPAVAIETHGCKLNQADSGVLASEFIRSGFRIVSYNEPADVYLSTHAR